MGTATSSSECCERRQRARSDRTEKSGNYDETASAGHCIAASLLHLIHTYFLRTQPSTHGPLPCDFLLLPPDPPPAAVDALGSSNAPEDTLFFTAALLPEPLPLPVDALMGTEAEAEAVGRGGVVEGDRAAAASWRQHKDQGQG